MTNERDQEPPEDEMQVDTGDPWEVLLLCRNLGITKTQLEIAVHAVGTSLDDIRLFIAKNQLHK